MARYRVAFCTGARAEYGLLKPLIEQFMSDPNVDTGLIVTGMHLCKEYGNTIEVIQSDNMPIWDTIDILLSSNTQCSIVKSMGLALLGFSESLNKIKPDILILLGDRFEAFCAAAAAVVLNIPIAHIHGGELTEGAIDDAFRHAITKMSYLHFTSTEEYRRRVIQMGEEPDRVFNVGSLGVENIRKLKLLDRDELQKELGIDLSKPYCVCTFHPETLEPDKTIDHLYELIGALDKVNNQTIIFTGSNADSKGKKINQIIKSFVDERRSRTYFFLNLGQLKYLSLLKYAQFVVGNSSSGIIEAPALGIPTINIGSRQNGRVKPQSVFDSKPQKDEILKTITYVLENSSKLSGKSLDSLFKGDDVAKRIYDTCISFLKNGIKNKHFYDIQFNY
jgi:UDP-hydrolysing UDP-N-acetyl-D-glucosamine 2-epimerase